MPTIQEIISHLESIAPPAYQENYDNAGLLTGNASMEATGALCCLDATEAVIEEAAEKGCNLVVAHHPIVFKGLKRLNGRNYVERAIIKAIKLDVAIYAIHTNLDNVYHKGVNGRIAEKLGLRNTRILLPGKALKKLSVFVATDKVEPLRAALFEAGAGNVNGADGASFATLGVGTSGGAVGAQMKLEVIFPAPCESAVRSALRRLAPAAHHEITLLDNSNLETGAGLIGELPKAVKENVFLSGLKKTMQAGIVRHTRTLGKPIHTVALCGGSGSFLLGAAIAQGADAYVSADFKYHEFFDADGRILIADIGHFESEQFTIDLLHDIISEKFHTFAPLKTSVNTNPVFYL